MNHIKVKIYLEFSLFLLVFRCFEVKFPSESRSLMILPEWVVANVWGNKLEAVSNWPRPELYNCGKNLAITIKLQLSLYFFVITITIIPNKKQNQLQLDVNYF